ncbi:MAG: Rieske 2Fe-2S domain-containing protein [Novosphingobium sp.]
MISGENTGSPTDAWRLRPQSPEPDTVLGGIEQIDDGGSKEFVFGAGLNAFRMFVVRKGERVFGYVNLCPHYSLPLNVRDNEFLSRDGLQIMCRRHLAIFTIEDGLCVDGACIGSKLDVVPLKVNDTGAITIG